MMGSYTPEQRRLEWLYGLLGLYNGLVVLLMAGFMCLTQQKIVSTMSAHEFLSTLPIVPLPAMKGFWLSMGAYALLLFLGKLYRHGGLESGQRQLIFAAEIGICMLLMKSLNLAYDGIVLLAVADLMHRYQGENQSWLLLVAMLGLYFMANYNMAIFQRHVAPFDVYAAYYRPEVQSVLLAIKNAFQSLNIVLFVLYLVLLVQSKHHEKERIAILNQQLEEANVRLRAFALEAERTAETRERNRLAREIHDTLGHTLTGIVAGLDACIVLVDTAPAVVKKQLEKIRETARHGIVDVRRSVKKLRPDDLEKMPLQQAIKKVIAEFSASSGVEIQLVELGWPEKLREDEEEVIYRIVQEGITNSRRHGKATKVTVTCGLEPGRFYIMIADNGEGCADLKQGFGLRHMEERLELLHGRLRYWSDKGFTLEATIPMGKNVMDNHGEDKE